jgi:ubiquinone biosynthesis protein UbiJ
MAERDLVQSVGSRITRSSVRVRGTLDVSGNELVSVLRSVALALEESTRMLVRITDLHDEAADMQGQLAEALADLERILARLEENEPLTDL